MDPLTHTATGLFLSRAGLVRYTPCAPWILVLAANAPDIDAVAGFGGGLAYLEYHRHLTHALAAAPVLALLPPLIVRLLCGKPLHWRNAYLLSLAAVLSHLALDWTNMYGIRLLLPFSARWLRLDLTAVVDVWIWATFLLCIAGPLVARLVNLEIGARARPTGRGFAWLALTFLVLYNCGRAVLHARALETLESRIYEGMAPARVAALPHPLNPFRWRGLVETAGFYSIQEVNLLAEFDPTLGRTFYKPNSAAAIHAVENTAAFVNFQRFCQYPLWRTTPVPEPENGTRVELLDLRFGAPGAPGFRATAILDSRLTVIRSWFEFGRLAPR